MKGALASNWVLETFENVSGGFKLLGTSKGYTSFSRAFKDGDKVFYAAHTDDGHREAGWAVVQGSNLVDRNPTATLTPQNVYTEGTPAPLAFQGQGTIACTFNAVAFDTIWDHVFREDNPHNVTADQVPQDDANGRGDNVQDALDNISDDLNAHKADTSNPHDVKAPQVDLEPVLLPLAPNEQNVQDALEFLFSYFSENSDGDWHITHIDGNHVYIEIKHGPRAEFPPSTSDLKLAELKINHDDGHLWTKLADGTVVKIGDKDLITEAPLDGELYGRKDGAWHRISLATVSDNMPQNPEEGDLWVDTKNTLELYVYIDANGWVSMTGAGSGSGGAADNIVTDDMDGTLVNRLLGREIDEEGNGRWRPIYSDDVIPADGAGAMVRTDGSVLRNQADINKFLYSLAVQGGGGGGTGGGDGNWHELPTGDLILKSSGARPTGSASANELHIWHLDPADCTTSPNQEFKVNWAGGKDIIDKFNDDGIGFLIKLVQGPLEMSMRANGSGWITNNTVWHVSCEEVTGDVLVADDPVEMQIMYDVSQGTVDWVNEHFVNVEGDEMTGPLEVKDTVTADRVHTTHLDSAQNTNLSLQRRGDTKLLLSSTETLAYQPLKYNADYTLDHERHLITKGYVDDLVEEHATDAADAYVQKASEKGDHMMGPLNIQTATGTGSRESRRINTLGVYSNSTSSSLQLGTDVTKIYVGNNDTSFNGPIKVGEITDRGSNIKISAPLQFAQHDELMQINTNNGNTQNINVFKGSNSEFTTLKVNINGATWKNAIEFESGPTGNKETVLRLDSNKGLKARNLNMDDTQITKLADPINPTDAVNLQTVDGKVEDLAESLRDRLDTLVTDNSAGEMKFGIFMEPTSNGQFTCMTLNGASSTYDPLQTKEIWAHNKNLGGYDFNWTDVKPNSYFFMSGPGDALARFRVVADPIDQGAWTKIKVADAEVYPDGQQWVVNDVWDVLFRSFTGASTDLDDYVKKSGDVMTGTLGAPRVEVKDDDTGVLVVAGNQSAPADAAARITMSNAYNSNAYGTLEWHATTGSNGWFQFSDNVDFGGKGLHGVGHVRFKGGTSTLVENTATRVTFDTRTIVEKGNASTGAGFELKGHTSEGNNAKLLQVYHNGGGSVDAVNYYGKQEGDNNILTVGGAKEMFQAIDLDEEQGPLGQLAPHGPLTAVGNVTRAPNAGEMTFDNYEMRLTTLVKMHKTDKTGETHEYKYNEDSILTLNFTDTVDGNDISWNTSVRVDGITDRGSYIELVIDPRDAWVRSETGLFNPSMQFWYYNNGAVVTPMGRQIASYDDLFELRDEAGRLASLLTYRVSTNAVPFLGGAPGTMYFEGSINNPTTIKLSNRDAYFAGIDVNKNNTSSTMNIPGNIVIYDQAETNRAAVPVMIWGFSSLRSDGTKKTVQLNSPTKIYQHTSVPVDTSTYYRVEVNFTPGVTAAASTVTHTMMGKGMWGESIDQLATDHFVGIDYYGNTRNALDNYTMGIVVATRFGNEFTEGLEWKEGAYLEVFNSEGSLLFAKEIDYIEHDDKKYMRLMWEWQPNMYVYESSHKYGDLLMLKITGLTGDVRPSREASASE